MKKTLIILGVVMIFLVATASVALAFNGYGPGGGYCLQDSLAGEDQTRFNEIIENFREQMFALRERMSEARSEGDYEEFLEVKEERFELMEEKRDALAEILPDEYVGRFNHCGREGRNSGWQKGNSGFKSQQGFNTQ